MSARIYRTSTGRLDWQMTMAREWANETDRYTSGGMGGGWIYTKDMSRAVVQGWGALFTRYRTQILDWYTKRYTGFGTFQEMIAAPGNYRPTFLAGGRGGWRYEALAEAYDQAQSSRNDSRRAYRGTRAA